MEVVTPAAHAAALWTGLNLALMLVLAVRVTRLRRKHRIAFGDGDVPELAQAVRAFGNAAEYVPAALVGLAVLALVQAAPALIHVTGFLLLAGRIAHGVGLSRSAGPSLPRNLGATATWLAYLFAAAALVFYAIP